MSILTLKHIKLVVTGFVQVNKISSLKTHMDHKQLIKQLNVLNTAL